MKTLTGPIQAKYTIKKSRFLCFGYSIQSKNDAKQLIQNLKQKYSDASHICYAYILDNQNYYFNDGGEPSGTAGKPIYGAIQANHLNYVLVVVVRYFGGIKFGPGPLRSTFKDVASQTLKLATFKTCVLSDVIQIKVAYDSLTHTSSVLKKWIYDKAFYKEYALLTLVGNKTQILKQLSNLSIEPINIKENQVV